MKRMIITPNISFMNSFKKDGNKCGWKKHDSRIETEKFRRNKELFHYRNKPKWLRKIIKEKKKKHIK